MHEALVQIVFGWPTVGLALGLALAGLAARRPALVALGALAAVPFTWYVHGYPSIGWPIVLGAWLPFLAAAEALRRGRRGLAAVGLVPFGMLAGVLLFLVIFQHQRPMASPSEVVPAPPNASGTAGPYPGTPFP